MNVTVVPIDDVILIRVPPDCENTYDVAHSWSIEFPYNRIVVASDEPDGVLRVHHTMRSQ